MCLGTSPISRTLQRGADSKKDNLMDRTDANTQSWIASRFTLYMALINRCNVWSPLNTLAPSPRHSVRCVVAQLVQAPFRPARPLLCM